ncbi:hypothetical protein GRAN_4183 [Granulicella sibirica]|uniref:Uncharacterized protein n=1 Tax=Granulicella sibirica TaxID=2479048 RepID=A0A4Q0SZX9_9BACT|nr:hypothetical protein GRAN_4183 [Granulicella sibirica]
MRLDLGLRTRQERAIARQTLNQTENVRGVGRGSGTDNGAGTKRKAAVHGVPSLLFY